MASAGSPWRFAVGSGKAKVTALELPEKGSVVYLRWRENGNWKKVSLGESCRTASGRLVQAVCERAMAEARARSLGRAEAGDPSRPTSLSLAGTRLLAFHPTTGRWNEGTAHGREVMRALEVAERIWEPSRLWSALSRADWRSLWRARLGELRAAGHAGHRGTELVVQRIATIAEWLVEEGHVVRIQGPERGWKERLAEDFRQVAGDDPEPHRPRYTIEEMLRLLDAAQHGDPRFALLVALGAELRLGQVLRARRRDLDTTAWTLTIRGRGKKRGTTLVLTPGQRASVGVALAGYLRELEATGEDYPLFPAGQMKGGRKGCPVADPERQREHHINRRWVLDQFRACEERAGIPHLEGRGTYGIRRVSVDGAKVLGISREGLMAHGGWTSQQIPDAIYAERETLAYAEEAARIRARLRGESEIAPSLEQTYPARTPG